MPPLSSFFLVLLEHYGLQLQHLLPHSITLVAVFAHFCVIPGFYAKTKYSSYA
jgi:hypothetical protein